MKIFRIIIKGIIIKTKVVGKRRKKFGGQKIEGANGLRSCMNLMTDVTPSRNIFKRRCSVKHLSPDGD